MSWEAVADVVAAVLLLAGAVLTLAAGIGVLRFPDLLARMHAGTKPQVLGLVLVLTAEALRVRSPAVLGLLLVVVVFQFLTVPVAAHMVARSGYRTGQVRRDLLIDDELARDQDNAVLEVERVRDESEGDEADPPPKARRSGDLPG